MRFLPSRIRDLIRPFFERKSGHVSQAGQDQWVFGEVFNEAEGGFFLDIGAHNGLTISNTFLLERRYKWRGICIEANPVLFKKLRANRTCSCLNVCLDRTEGEVSFALRDVFGGIVDSGLDNASQSAAQTVRVKTLTLVSVLDQQKAPTVIDYLSIDVEGAEERILDHFDFERYRFNCITIERPSDVLRNLFAKHGYVLVKDIPDLDAFYVHQQYLDSYKKNVYAFYQKRQFAFRWR